MPTQPINGPSAMALTLSDKLHNSNPAAKQMAQTAKRVDKKRALPPEPAQPATNSGAKSESLSSESRAKRLRIMVAAAAAAATAAAAAAGPSDDASMTDAVPSLAPSSPGGGGAGNALIPRATPPSASAAAAAGFLPPAGGGGGESNGPAALQPAGAAAKLPEQLTVEKILRAAYGENSDIQTNDPRLTALSTSQLRAMVVSLATRAGDLMREADDLNSFVFAEENPAAAAASASAAVSGGSSNAMSDVASAPAQPAGSLPPPGGGGGSSALITPPPASAAASNSAGKPQTPKDPPILSSTERALAQALVNEQARVRELETEINKVKATHLFNLKKDRSKHKETIKAKDTELMRLQSELASSLSNNAAIQAERAQQIETKNAQLMRLQSELTRSLSNNAAIQTEYAARVEELQKEIKLLSDLVNNHEELEVLYKSVAAKATTAAAIAGFLT